MFAFNKYGLLAVVVFFILLFCYLSFERGTALDDPEKKYFIISSGGHLAKYSLINNEFRYIKNILPDKKWANAYWPTYDKKNKILYFEANNYDIGLSICLFSKKIAANDQPPEKLIEGRNPSISSNGEYLAYYRHPNQLWLLTIKTHETRILLKNFLDHVPVVWTSSQELLYSDTDHHMMRLNIDTGDLNDTDHKYIIPITLSPLGNKVLCSAYDGSGIFLYDIKTNQIETIRKSIFFSMGSSLWLNDGKHFLYTRQILANQIKLNESQSLFVYSLADGKEAILSDKFSLFGGLSINEE